MKEANAHIIHKLVEKTDYKDLTSDQRELVLMVLTEQEYNHQRKTLLWSQTSFDVDNMLIQPDPMILTKLQAQLNAKQKQSAKSYFHKFASYKMPVYQAVAAILLAFISAIIIFKESPQTPLVEQKITVIQPVHDTVYVERIREVDKIKIVHVQQPPTQLKSPQMPSSEMAQTVNTNKPNIQDFAKTFGNSPMSEKELNQFRVSL